MHERILIGCISNYFEYAPISSRLLNLEILKDKLAFLLEKKYELFDDVLTELTRISSGWFESSYLI